MPISGRFPHRSRMSMAALLAMAVLQTSSLAFADQTKQDNLTPLNVSGSWSSGVPGPTDVAIFDNTLAGTGGYAFSMGADGTWAGIRLVNPASSIIIANNTLTLGASGIDLSAATQSLTLNSNLSAANSQTWNSATSLTLNGSVNLLSSAVIIRGIGTTTVNGAISATNGSITKDDSGTLTLAGTNSFGAGVTLLAGTLNIGTPSALGTGTFTVSGGTFDNTSGAPLTLSNGSSLSGFTTFTGTQPLTLTSGLSLASTATISTTSGVLTLAGSITNPFGPGLVKTGAGSLALSGSNSYTGGFTQLAGVTTLASNSAAGSSGSPITLNGGTLVLAAPTGSLTLQNAFNINGNIGLALNSTASIGKNSIVGNGNISISLLANTLDFGGGSSTVPAVFSGFSGTLDFGTSTGVVVLGSATASPNLVDLSLGSATLALGSASLTLLTAKGSTQTIGALSGGANTTFGGGNTGSTTYNLSSLASSTFNGSIVNGTSGGTTAISKLGSTTLTLTGTASNYSGILSIQNGVLAISSPSALGAASSPALNLLISNAATAATLRYTGTAGSTARLFTIASAAAIDSSGTGPITFSNTGAIAFGGSPTNRTLTLTGSNTGANLFNPQIRDVSSAQTSLIKSGTGTWELIGLSNTLSGPISVTQGTLLVSAGIGTPTGTGNISISPGATYGGTGNNANIGAITVSGNAHLAPGIPNGGTSGVGTLNVNSLSFNANSILDLDIDPAIGNDVVNILSSSTLTLAAPVNVNVYQGDTNITYGTSGSFGIFTGVNNLVGNPATDLHVINGAGATYTFAQINSTIYLTISGSGPPPGWLGSTSSDWSDASNWSGGIPDAIGATAIFGPTFATSFTPNLNGSRTVGVLALDSGTHAGYVIGPGTGGTLILNNSGTALVNVTSGAHTISADLQLAGDTTFNFSSSSSVTVSGLLTASGTPTITVTGSGTLLLWGNNNFPGTFAVTSNLTFANNSNQNIQGITGSGNIQIGGGTNLTSGRLTAASLLVGGTYTLRSQTTISGTSVLSLLTIAGNPDSAGGWTGKLDLTNNALVLLNPNTTSKFSAIATLTDEAFSGKNGGSWNGTGITSSSIATNANTTLAIVDAAELGTTSFRGQAIDANSVIVTQALIGDTNLSGTVDFTDLLKVAQDFGLPGGWARGNVDGSSTVGFGDLLAVAQHFGQSEPIFASKIAINAVPEPNLNLLWVLSGVSLGLKRRVRREKSLM